MKYILITLLFIGSILSVNGQEITDPIKKGNELLFYGKTHQSISYFQKALDHYIQEKNPYKIAEVHNQLAKAHHLIFDLKKADYHVKESLKQSKNTNSLNPKEEANSLDHKGTILAIQKSSAKAFEMYLKAFEIRKNLQPIDSLAMAISYYNLGNVLISQSKYDESESYLQKALDINPNTTPEATILKADTHESFGYIAYEKGRADEALKSFQTGLKIAKRVFKENNSYFSDVYNQLGLIYAFKNQLSESLSYYQKALNVSIENYGLDKHPGQIKIHYNIGTIYRKQGDVEKALYHTQKTLDFGIKVFGEQHENLFYPYSQMGQIYGDQRGIPFLEKALTIFKGKEKKRPMIVSHLYEYLSMIYYNIGDTENALFYGEKALNLRLATLGENSSYTMRSRNQMTQFLVNLDQFENALLHNSKAITSNNLNSLDEDILLESVQIQSTIYFQLYLKNKHHEDLEESMKLNCQALELVESIRKKNRNYEDKIRFSETVKSIYAKAIEFSLLLDKKEAPLKEEGFGYAEQSKSNVLRELMEHADVKRTANIPPALLEQEKRLNSNIARLMSKVFIASNKEEVDSSFVIHLNAQILDLRSQKDSLVEQMEIQFPTYYQKKHGSNHLSVPAIQSKLKADTTFIEFFTCEDHVYVFIITGNDFQVLSLEIDDLKRKIQLFNQSIVQKDQEGFEKISRELYRLLLKPAESYLRGDQLIIVPDESLWNLHFDLLITDDFDNNKPNYLLNTYAISYANSASIFFRESKDEMPNEKKDECLAFSYSSLEKATSIISLETLRNSDVDLPGTRKEVFELSKVFDGTYYFGEDANEENFKESAEKYRLIHLALHGEIDHHNPMNSKIFFTDTDKGNQEDNRLYAHELYAMNIPADLVVLSACDTGSGKVNKGEGILSLGTAFQSAGAESLLLSKWKISDKTTPKIMKLFYQNLEGGMNKSRALQQAKLQFLKGSDVFDEAPFYWGSFYLIGDIDPIILETSMKNYSLVFLIVSGLFVFIFFSRKKSQ